MARDAAAESHPFDDVAAGDGGAGGNAGGDAARRFRTLIHGDPKAANLLLHEGGAVGFIDFQWTGWGAPYLPISPISPISPHIPVDRLGCAAPHTAPLFNPSSPTPCPAPKR